MPSTPDALVTLRLAQPGELALLEAIDDDASASYAAHGLAIELAPDHVFVREERARWHSSIELGRAFIAIDAHGAGVGFAALDTVDAAPYLDQLAVRRSAMRQGIGSLLLARAAEWARDAGGAVLWLTTYAQLPFNRPYYERNGYEVVPEHECGPGIIHHLAEQRRHLPAPAERVAMRRRV
jgi:GNAT superfamily N-acetyltransferase